MEHANLKLIKEIAQELNCGNDCYYNSKTEEIIAILNFSNFIDDEEFKKLFKEDLKKVKKNKVDYIKIETLESNESFKIMELFVDHMLETPLKFELETILQRKKPFQNFKDVVETSEHRAAWFEFKQKKLEKIVKRRLEIE